MAETVTLQPITEEMLAELWSISYGPKADLEWKKWDGPYFQVPVFTREEFRTGFGASCIDIPLRKAISYQGRIVGIATAYWEDNTLQQWLEFGIAIYDASLWNQGIGSQAIRQWINELFESQPHIQRVGYTTWSGNHRMMKLGEKLGMTKEAQIRKVRFWEGTYYDSIKYGILREEWAQQK